MKRVFYASLMLVLLPTLAFARETLSRHTMAYFSTFSALSVCAEEDEFERLWEETKRIMEDVEQSVSLAFPDSDIARFNALACGESCPVSDTTAEILRIAQEIWRETGGLYDPTVYPLVDLWGFSPRFNRNQYAKQQPYDRDYENGVLPLPEEGYRQAFCALVGLDGMTLEGESGAWRLTKNTPDVRYAGETWHAQMDLGGIAKGYVCDRVAAMLREAGCEVGYFSCGGSSLSILRSEGGKYQMTIGKPRQGAERTKHYAALWLQDTGLSTSSDQNHCFIRDGVVYCHIIDPRTGWPVNTPAESGKQEGMVSVTLLAESAAACDALTTALMIMGKEEALRFLEAHPELNGIFVVSGQAGCEVFGNLPEEAVELADSAYLWRGMGENEVR